MNMNVKKILLILPILILGTGLCIWYLAVSEREHKQNLDKQAELLQYIQSEKNDISDSIIETGFITTEEPVNEDNIIESTTLETDSIEYEIPVIGIGIVTIDKIDLEMPVVEVISENLLNIALCHVSETAQTGEVGNSVIAGHRGYVYGEYLNRLDEMEIGDLIYYTPVDDEIITFEVYEITEITPEDQTAFEQPNDKSVLTLYTCTPVHNATRRLLVRAIKITEE